MDFLNYSELVSHIKQATNQQEQLNIIIQYFLENVEFDYVMVEHTNKLASPRLAQYIDKIFPNINDKFREKALAYLRNCTNISDTYWERIKKQYLTPTIDENEDEEYMSLTETLSSITPDYRAKDGLLQKGVDAHIVQFAKKLCDDVGIKCIIVEGFSSENFEHAWLDICIDNKELFYDIAYCLYIRDNFCGVGARYTINDWIGISPKKLYKNQPTRTISHPQGFNLEYLGLNNLPLCMNQFFDLPVSSNT
ncbi:MAG: hypothetical protein J6Q15_02085 [Clostridia bacterium]|nr:hypothetical protein [Clostridia bacterium]